MGPARQQPALIIERPPYYRPPRNRPVSFESPLEARQQACWQQSSTSGCCPKVHVYINHGQENFQEARGGGHEQRKPEMLPSYNSLPKPYSRESNLRQAHYVEAENFRQEPIAPRVPKILVNNQSHAVVYPTSTVHKSMLGSHSTGSGEINNSNYARLISPTTSSYEQTTASSLSRSTNAEGLDQQVGNKCRPEAEGHFRPEPVAGSGRAGGAQLREPLARLPRQRLAQHVDSNTVLPDSKRDEFMWDRQIERASIAHQNYRTLPIVLPRPKARHDLASGIYMRLSYDPTWDLALSKPAPGANRAKDYAERRIREAIGGGSNLLGSQDLRSPLPVGQSQTRPGCTCVLSQHLCANCPAHSASGLANERSTSASPMALSPAFNYREYIESTRRAT